MKTKKHRASVGGSIRQAPKPSTEKTLFQEAWLISVLISTIITLIAWINIKDHERAIVIGILSLVITVLIEQRHDTKKRFGQLHAVLDLAQLETDNKKLVEQLLQLLRLSITADSMYPAGVIKSSISQDVNQLTARLLDATQGVITVDELVRQEWLIELFSNATSGDTLFTTSFVNIEQWWESPTGRRYWEENRRAKQRGVQIYRVFILDKEQLSDEKQRSLLWNSLKNNLDTGIYISIVYRDSLAADSMMNFCCMNEDVVSWTGITPRGALSKGTISYSQHHIDQFRQIRRILEEAAKPVYGLGDISSALSYTPDFGTPSTQAKPFEFVIQNRTIHFNIAQNVMFPSPHSFFIAAHVDCATAESALDVGCGSGLLAILCAKAGVPRVVAVDCDPTAIETTRLNGKLNGISDEQLNTHLSDLFESVRGQQFDLIVCNPPTLPESVDLPRYYWGGVNGTEFLLRLLKEAQSYLSERGRLFFVVSSRIDRDEIESGLRAGQLAGTVIAETILPCRLVYQNVLRLQPHIRKLRFLELDSQEYEILRIYEAIRK